MKKCQPLESSQHQNDTTNIYKNNTPKLSKKPLNKSSSYELLLNEFYVVSFLCLQRS